MTRREVNTGILASAGEQADCEVSDILVEERRRALSLFAYLGWSQRQIVGLRTRRPDLLRGGVYHLWAFRLQRLKPGSMSAVRFFTSEAPA